MLTRKTLAASFWSGADIAGRQGLQFIIGIVLARLLTPSEFGTIALLYFLVALARSLADSGLSTALIQRPDATPAEESTVFWFNAAAGLLMALLLCAGAPWFAAFYGIPALAGLTIALAANVFMTALGAIHITLLTKRTDFVTIMKASLISAAVSGGVAIVLAYRGFGVWALAAQAVTASAAHTIALWMLHRWRPAATFDLAALRRLWAFGGYVMIASLLEVLYSRGYLFLIGRYRGVQELGYYDRAEGTRRLPVNAMTAVFGRVMLPVFSAAASDSAMLRRGARQSVRALMFLMVPIMLALMASAEPLFETLFGRRWLPSVPMFQVLCLASALWPLHVVNLNVLLAQGHSRLYFRLQLVKMTSGILLLVAGIPWGVMGIAWSQVAAGIVAFAINAHYTRVHLDWGPLRQLADVVPIAAPAVTAAGAAFLFQRVVSGPPFVIAGAQLAVAIVGFLLLCAAFRVAILEEVWRLIRYGAPR